MLGENPLTSRAWKEPVVIDTWEGLLKQRTDMCAFVGLRRPDGEWNPAVRGLYLRKPTWLTGQEEILRRACRVCPGNHRHSPCLGGVRVHGRWCSLSDLAGGYTKKFAQAIVIGAEEFLKGRGSKRKDINTFLTTPLLPEEVFMDDPLDFASSHVVPCHGTWAGHSQGPSAMTTRTSSTITKPLLDKGVTTNQFMLNQLIPATRRTSSTISKPLPEKGAFLTATASHDASSSTWPSYCRVSDTYAPACRCI